MLTQYDLELSIQLEPIWHDDPPQVRLICYDLVQDIVLDATRIVNLSFQSSGAQRLTIEFLNKHDRDTVPNLGLDKAVNIKEISFFGISDPRFVWLGRYRPSYPEPWYSEQKAIDRTPDPELIGVDRLSWNGIWILEFYLPIFSWMHQVQNLGWIYR